MTQVAALGDGHHRRVISDSSRDAGWRSVALRRVVNDRNVDYVELPPVDAQTIVPTLRGRAVVEARDEFGRWHRSDYAPGWLGMTAPRVGLDDPRLERAVEFMHENLSMPITLADMADMAEAAGVSSFHFRAHVPRGDGRAAAEVPDSPAPRGGPLTARTGRDVHHRHRVQL